LGQVLVMEAPPGRRVRAKGFAGILGVTAGFQFQVHNLDFQQISVVPLSIRDAAIGTAYQSSFSS
jgi:hypothetical protein